MRVQLKTGRVGDRFAQSAGDIIEIDDATGQRMLDAGQCSLVEATKEQSGNKGK